MSTDNKVDSVINEVLESKRVKQGAVFIKKLAIVGFTLFILFIITALIHDRA